MEERGMDIKESEYSYVAIYDLGHILRVRGIAE